MERVCQKIQFMAVIFEMLNLAELAHGAWLEMRSKGSHALMIRHNHHHAAVVVSLPLGFINAKQDLST